MAVLFDSISPIKAIKALEADACTISHQHNGWQVQANALNFGNIHASHIAEGLQYLHMLQGSLLVISSGKQLLLVAGQGLLLQAGHQYELIGAGDLPSRYIIIAHEDLNTNDESAY